MSKSRRVKAMTAEAVKGMIDQLPREEQWKLFFLQLQDPRSFVNNHILAQLHTYDTRVSQLESQIENSAGNKAKPEKDRALVEFYDSHDLKATAKYLGLRPDTNGVNAAHKRVAGAMKRIAARQKAFQTFWQPPQ